MWIYVAKCVTSGPQWLSSCGTPGVKTDRHHRNRRPPSTPTPTPTRVAVRRSPFADRQVAAPALRLRSNLFDPHPHPRPFAWSRTAAPSATCSFARLWPSPAGPCPALARCCCSFRKTSPLVRTATCRNTSPLARNGNFAAQRCSALCTVKNERSP